MLNRKPLTYWLSSGPDVIALLIKIIFIFFFIRFLTLLGVSLFPTIEPQFILTLVLLLVIHSYLLINPGPVHHLSRYFHLPVLTQSDISVPNPVSIPVSKPGAQTLRFKQMLFFFLMVVGWVPVNLGIAVILQWVYPMPAELEQVFRELTSPEKRVEILLVAVIIYPILEELLCRGIIQDIARKQVSAIWAVLISSVFFAFMHWNIWQGIPAFLTGILLGYLAVITGNLRLPIVFHSLYNLLVLLIQWGAQSQLSEVPMGIGDLRNTTETLIVGMVFLGFGIWASSILIPKTMRSLAQDS